MQIRIEKLKLIIGELNHVQKINNASIYLQAEGIADLYKQGVEEGDS